MRRCSLVITVLTFVASLFVASGAAQAVVVNDGGTVAGVALVPSTRSNQAAYLAAAGVSTVVSGGSCSDPWLASDFGGPFLPAGALCWHSGRVMHGNETFALTWDPNGSSWPGTTGYLEQFLRDVADGSGTLTSPYAVTSQYADGIGDTTDGQANPTGQARNLSKFGGGCIDSGVTGHSACQFGTTNGTGDGHNYPQPNSCPTSAGNLDCLTDADIQAEVATMAQQTGLSGRTQAGYTPLLVVLIPHGVQVCLDSGGSLCSVNSTSIAKFCSYHSHVNVPGVGDLAYVVQPWTINTNCDEPHIPPLPEDPTPAQLQTDAGVRLASPLSQGQIAAIVNPFLSGWFANDGSEIQDNGGCAPLGVPHDNVVVGNSGQNPYVLQREFNNGGAIENNPNTYFGCAPVVLLSPTFVVPSAVDQGDVVQLDGSTTASTLLVPNASYAWSFGDGTTAVGPSVEHAYAHGGTYTVTLTVTDRGGNVRSLSQSIEVLGQSGQVVTPPGGGGGGGGGHPGLQVHMQLMPQSLKSVLRSGVSVRVSSNQAANGIAQISIAHSTAKRAHIKGRGKSVIIGRGTLSGVKNGVVTLHLHLSRSVVNKLKHLRHVTLTIKLSLVSASGAHLAVDAAGHY